MKLSSYICQKIASLEQYFPSDGGTILEIERQFIVNHNINVFCYLKNTYSKVTITTKLPYK